MIRKHLYGLGFITLSALLAACGGGGGGGSSPSEPPVTTTPQTIVVQIQDNQFSPKQITINPGDTVRWVRTGSSPAHTVTALDGSFDSGTTFMQANAVYEHRFDTTGKTYEYQCKTHYSCCQMQGSIQVGATAPPPKPGY
jgi:plastocyanin